MIFLFFQYCLIRDFQKKVRTHFLEVLESLKIKELLKSKRKQKEDDQVQESCKSLDINLGAPPK